MQPRQKTAHLTFSYASQPERHGAPRSKAKKSVTLIHLWQGTSSRRVGRRRRSHQTVRRPEPDSSPAQGREQKAGIPTKTSVAGTAFLATRRQSLCPEAEKRVMTLSGCSKHRGQPPFLFHLLGRTVLKGAVACFAQRRWGPTELYELLRLCSPSTFSCGHKGGGLHGVGRELR